MKKNLTLILVLVFIFSLAINLPVKAEGAPAANNNTKASSSLEKIAHPEQIKFFEKITQIGNTLFGIRKVNTTKTENATTTNLEKIPSPENIKFFDKITKIGTTLFGIRKDAPKPSEVKDKTIQLPIMNAETITCVSAAIDFKDTSVASAFTAATTEIAGAMKVRGTCQKVALNLTSGDRQAEINVCNKSFQETSKKSHETAKNAQKEAWTTYDNGLKECTKKNTTATTTSEVKTEIHIEDGGQSIDEVLVQ